MNLLKKLFVSSLLSLTLITFLGQKVFAAENTDNNVPECTIVVNGVILPNHSDSINRDTAPKISASEIAPDRSFAKWNASVTLSPAAQARLQACGGQLAVARSTAGSWVNSVISNSLTNVYQFTILRDGQDMYSSTDFPISVDIEINESPSKPILCPNLEPICRRAYIRLDQDTISNTELSCSDELAKFKSFVLGQGGQATLGQSYGFAYNTTNLKTACLLADIMVDYSRTEGNDSSTKYFSLDSNPSNFSFEPKYIGNYNLNFTVQKSSGLIKTTLDSFTKELCVAKPGSPCEEPAQPGAEIESLPAFNICRQIPVLNDEQINNRIAQAPENQRAALTTELQARKESYRKEKIACCLCATGNEALDANGQCPESLPSKDANFTPGLYTAVGCVPTTPEGIVTKMVTVGLGLAGGVALLMILSGSFIYTTSQGEPKKIGEAKEMITSAVMGLLFIIFSVTILRFIGVNILQIPGFGQ